MTRRTFLAASTASLAAAAAADTPWYRRTLRWGQTNLTEADPPRYDMRFWRDYWKRTAVQGVIVNAGGIVAYYPSKFPLQHRAQFLDGRDLFGEITEAARQDGLVVLARMDSNRTAEDFYKAHPGWFARNAAGEPYRAADKYITCINSGYYSEYLPDVLREIVDRYHPAGFTDNSWAGLDRGSICYCENCSRKFARPLPRKADWDDPAYREWILWNYSVRTALWEFNNGVTTKAGGNHCVWVGMNTGHVAGSAHSFRDLREIARRAPMMLLDHQRRPDNGLLQQNSDTGKLIHGVLGWDKLAPESMAMYQSGGDSFRVSAKPAPEARLWMLEGFAGGIQPWWHHVGAYHEDRRAYATAPPVMEWHRANERFLVDRKPLATVGVAWSQRNTDFYGRDHAERLTEAPYRGIIAALTRHRIPYIPVHIADVGDVPLDTLVLPDIAAMSGDDCARVRRFVANGGKLLATGLTSLYDEWGDPRNDYGLADLFGAHRTGPPPERTARISTRHSYLRGNAGILQDTDIIAYGGALDPLRLEPGTAAPLTYIPPFPIYPPETAWMRTPKTDIPGLVLNGRVAYLQADLDRRYAFDNLPDHAALLAGILLRLLQTSLPFEVTGAGLLDCNAYTQPGRTILHIVNLTNPGAWRAPVDELYPVRDIAVRLRTPVKNVRLLVSGARLQTQDRTFTIPVILDHEVAVIE